MIALICDHSLNRSVIYGQTPIERKREKTMKLKSEKKGDASKEGNLNKALFMRDGGLRPAH